MSSNDSTSPHSETKSSTDLLKALMAPRNWFSRYDMLQENDMENMSQGTMSAPSSQLPPPNAERGKKEIVQPQRRIGKAPIDEPMEEVFTPPSKGKNRGPIAMPPSCGAAASNIQSMMMRVVENRKHGVPLSETPVSTKKRRVSEMMSSRFLQSLDKRGTMPEVKGALVESTTFLKPSDPVSYSQVQSKNARLEAEANELRTMNRKLKAEASKLKSKNVELQGVASELRSKNEGLQSNNEILKVTITSLNQKVQEVKRQKEEKEVELYVLTKANKNLLREISLRKDRFAILNSTHHTLQEKVAKLETDLTLVHELRHKDAIDRAQVEAKLNALQVRRNTDKYEAELDRNWVALKTRVNTLHEIQDGLDLPLAISEAEAAANSAREAVEQALTRNEVDGSKTEDAPPLP